jgi:hypothetical protein
VSTYFVTVDEYNDLYRLYLYQLDKDNKKWLNS